MLLLPQDIRTKIRDVFWNHAKTVYEYDGSWFCYCDYCHKKGLSSKYKVFHTKEGKKLFAKYLEDSSYLLTDHMFICPYCKYLLPQQWVGCKCSKDIRINKKKEDICQAK